MEDFLLFALAVIYFVIPYGHSPREHRAEGQSNQDHRSGSSQDGR
jgi:hypothetical protein